MIKGFRFTNQLANAEVDARIHQEFLNKNDGIFYGMDLSKTNNSITISEGLCEIAGRPVAVIGDETIQVSDENLYCVLVLEIDLSKESTKDVFNQVTFKLLTSNVNYSDVTQQDINKFAGTDKLYQLEFARFKSGTNGITDFKDTRKFLSMDSIYEQIKKEIKNIEDGSTFTLKEDFNDFKSKLQYSRRLVLHYNSSDTLQNVIDDIPNISENPNKYLVLLSLQEISQTPWTQVNKLSYEIRDNDWLVITAHGSGFVQGHTLAVSVLVYRLD